VVETDEGAIADHEPLTKLERRFGTSVKRTVTKRHKTLGIGPDIIPGGGGLARNFERSAACMTGASLVSFAMHQSRYPRRPSFCHGYKLDKVAHGQ